MDLAQIKQMLGVLGCPAEKCEEMASQLDKRARQLSTERGDSYERSIAYLISLMKQGWAAKERGF
jgi:hypothetical protein